MDGDWLLLRQAFLNLLTNAIKYSGVGEEIRISVGKDDQGMVRWTVADFGPGIAEEHPHEFSTASIVWTARGRGKQEAPVSDCRSRGA